MDFPVNFLTLTIVLTGIYFNFLVFQYLKTDDMLYISVMQCGAQNTVAVAQTGKQQRRFEGFIKQVFPDYI